MNLLKRITLAIFLLITVAGFSGTHYTSEEQKALNMIETQIKARGIHDSRVIAAMMQVPRHEFVASKLKNQAYGDGPLPIGFDQTISQPYIVAFMTEAAKIKASDKVLEIGTGSGYQAAILSKLAREVYSIEIIHALGIQAKRRFEKMGYHNIHTRIGDGYAGWKDAGPFDAILVTAAPNHIPRALKEQLKENGRLIIPVGESYQELRLIRKVKRKGKIVFESERLLPVRFVPMTGQASFEKPPEDFNEKPSEIK